MKEIINNTSFDIENIKNVVKGRIEPSIYAFKTDTVPSYLKVGDTYRDVDTRLVEWNELYNDIFNFEENERKVNPIVNKSAVLDKNNDIYFRDYSIHKFLNNLQKDEIHQITEEEREEFSKKHNNIHISNEFFKNATGKDVEDAIEDINIKYGKESGIYEYYNVYDKGREEEIYNATKEKNLRRNQEEVVDRFVEKYNKIRKGDKPLKLLMYAVMRFGKTFTALFCAKKVKAKVVVVLSAKADVHNEWRDNVQETIAFKNYKFISKNKKENNLKDFKKVLNGTYKQKEWMVDGKKVKEDKKDSVVVFLTLQDIQGDKIKKEHKDILKSDIDILIIDETHFGARAKSFGKVISNTEKENVKSDLVSENKNLKSFRNKNEDYYEIDDADEIINVAVEKKFKSVKIILHLSGTPYRILMSSEFPKENRIAEVTYNDILQSKKEWDDKFLKYDKVSDISDKNLKGEIIKQYGLKNGEDKEIEEYDNPYYGFPNMLRFGYRPSEKSLKVIEELKLKNDASSGLSNLLRPVSIVKDKEETYKKFRYEDEVLSIIKALDGKKEDKNIFPILKYEKDNNIVLSRHIVMVLPYCASCDAMKELLLNNKFVSLNEYEIINISGLDNEFKKVDDIKKKIEEIELRNFPEEYKKKKGKKVDVSDKKKSITLTVERMLTGSTVPYWDTMIFMRDTKDPQGYDQAIFRLQNQYIKEYKDEKTNKIIKRDMKPQTLLIDFSIERMYRLTEEKEFIYNIKDNKRDNDKLQESLSKSLKNSQIFVTAENKMIEAQPIDIMKIAARYNSEKSILDETKDIYFDKNILDNEKIREELLKQQDMKNKGGLEIKKDEDDGNNQDLNFGEAKADNNGKNESTNNKDNSKINNFDLSDEDKLKKEWEGKWQTYCSRLLFYAFLTESEICSIDEIINYENDKKNLDSNRRIIQNLDINMDTLKVLTEIVSDELLKNISDKIMNINTLSREEYDDEKDLTDFERKMKKINVAMNKFSRLGKSEIVTPINVCNDMINCFTDDEEQLKEALNSGKKILDINSKIAEFTVAFIKRFNDMGVTVDNNEYLENMFYSIPSAGYTYEFTRYVYEILGLNINNIATHFTSYSLIKDESLCKSKEVELEINGQLKNIKKQLKEINKFNELDNMDELSNKQKQKYEELLDMYKDEDIEELTNGLEEELNILENKKSKNIDFEKVCNILNQDKDFSKIRLNDEVKEIVNMKFDIVVGNPPYQEEDGGAQASAAPIYQNFVYISKLLTNRYISIIMPSRWYAGGKGLDIFREEMLTDKHIVLINDYLHPEEIFPDTNNRGGLCDFVWDKSFINNNEIDIVTHDKNEKVYISKTNLKDDKYEVFIRNGQSKGILDKVITTKNISFIDKNVSSRKPFGIESNIVKTKKWKVKNNSQQSLIKCLGKGEKIGYLNKDIVKQNNEVVNQWKIFTPRANNIGTELNDDNFNTFIGEPKMICTEAYIVIGINMNLKKKDCEHICKYFQTKFVRFMHSLAKASHDASKKTYQFVPQQNFSKESDVDWSKSIKDIDRQLYKKYKLNNEEINFIEETIKAM